MTEYKVAPCAYGGYNVLQIEYAAGGDAAYVVAHEETEAAATAWLQASGLAPATPPKKRAAQPKPEAPAWNRKLSPVTYLKRYPQGPDAELAKAVLASDGWGD